MTGFLRRVLRWTERLGAFPREPSGLPSATPFVSIYARGVLRGCYGSNEGLGRSALGALHDLRFGTIAPAERAELVAEVTYLRPPRQVRAADFECEIELGVEGASLVRGENITILLPNVARDEGLDARGLASVLARKAGVPIDERDQRLQLFSAHSVVVRRRALRRSVQKSPADAAAAWLAERVAADGSVEFGCEPRQRSHHAQGPFLHARSAVVISALGAHGGHRTTTARARRWLEGELRRAAAGRRIAMFPEHPAEVAGTLALARIAGLAVDSELRALAREPLVARDAWYAAQVVLALGDAAPRSLWQACVRDLPAHPWAPWTAMAARALGDAETLARAERALVDSLAKTPPYRGAANVRPVPELALTAVAVEALGPSRNPRARAAVERGRGFLLARQLRAGSIPGALDERLAAGAFPLSVVTPALRSDVTAHALLALL